MISLVFLAAILALCSAALLMVTKAAAIVFQVRNSNPFQKRKP